MAESADATVAAASELLAVGDRLRFLSALRRGNVRGALELGLSPGFLPGRVALDDGREWFAAHWGSVPDSRGLDATGILTAAHDGAIGALVLLGADVLDDFPDRTLARAALDAVPFVVAAGAFLTETAERADVFLPTTVWGEQSGTTTNLEGRVLRLGQKVSADGTPMPGWRIAAELALRFGGDWDLEMVEEVQDEIARVAPGFAGVDANLIRRAVDGVLLPKADHEDEIALTPLRIPVTNASWEPILPGVAEPAEAGDGRGRRRCSRRRARRGRSGGAAAVRLGAATSRPRRRPHATRTLCASWPAACSTTPVPRSPSRRRSARWHPARCCSCTVPTVSASGSTTAARCASPPRAGSLTLPVRTDAGTPPGVAFLAFNQAGPGAADLIDATEPVTDLRVESLR